jgi:hypothetical protein
VLSKARVGQKVPLNKVKVQEKAEKLNTYAKGRKSPFRPYIFTHKCPCAMSLPLHAHVFNFSTFLTLKLPELYIIYNSLCVKMQLKSALYKTNSHFRFKFKRYHLLRFRCFYVAIIEVGTWVTTFGSYEVFSRPNFGLNNT